ncbi:MAG TPA: transposase [Clostridia bacterium]|nr:transposase [Clostridia bacterium]
MFVKKQKAPQGELWVATHQLPTSAKTTFYSRLDKTLESFGFADKVRVLCAPAYKSTKAGRPGIDPVVYLKMIMVGFFEDLPSERAIAARCADSISIRSFLNYSLEEKTPDHSTFTVIRQRLGLEIYQQIFTLTLQALREHGLLRGKNLGIDSSVIEANASLRSLVHRNTEEQYWDYVKRLAAEHGIDPNDTGAVRKFDRHRPGKGSNQEWQNPHDPDAKIGRTKDGATDMIYKPEAVVDLDTGAIVQADVHPGDQADHKEMATRVLEAQQTINQAAGQKPDTLTVTSVTSDKGYYAVGELQALQHEGIRTVISDPIDNRRVDKLQPAEKRAVRGAKRSVRSKSGKELLRRRGMHIERSFAHILDAGGMRRTTLRGWDNLNKRFKLAAAFYNLSQLMRKLFGFGTPKQLAAAMEGGRRAFWGSLAFILTRIELVVHWITEMVARPQAADRIFSIAQPKFSPPENVITSTGC